MRLRTTLSNHLRWIAFLPLVLCFACTGSVSLYPVEGTVLYKGKEVSGAVVTFHPKGGDPITAIRPTAVTTSDGTFKLVTGEKAGAAAGEYVVTFLWPREVVAKKKMAMDMGTDTYDGFDGAYVDLAKSKHQIVIKPGENKLDAFRLD